MDNTDNPSLMGRFMTLRNGLVKSIAAPEPVNWRTTLLAVSIVLLPLFYLTVKNWTETFLVIIALLSAYELWKSRFTIRNLFPDGQTRWVFISLTAPLLGAFTSIILRGNLHRDLLAQNLDVLNGPSRLFMAGIGFLWMRHQKIQFLSSLGFICSVSVVITLFFATAQQPGTPDRYTTSLIDLDEFSQQICMLGLFQLALLIFSPPASKIRLALAVVSVFLAGKMAIAAGGRGGWIAVPPILMLIPFIYRGPKTRLLAITLMVVAAIGLTLAVNQSFYERAVSIYTGTKDWFAGSKSPGSGGAGRLSMWTISWQLIKQQPITGYGNKANFWGPVYSMDPSLYLRRGLTYEDEEYVRYTLCDTGEHNEYLNEWLINGASGLIAKLLLLFGPLLLFLKCLKSRDTKIYETSAIGACFVIVFIIHGITQGPFGYKVISSFYGFVIAGLSATCLQKERHRHVNEASA